MGLNHYSNILNYIKALGEADPFINTVGRGGDDLDLYKKNIFPLLTIDINSGSFTNGTVVVLQVEVAAWDIRDINKDIADDKLFSNDNEVDNLNETLATLNRVWTHMYRDFAKCGIQAQENPTIEALKFHDKNLLDGWVLTTNVQLSNTSLDLCDTVINC